MRCALRCRSRPSQLAGLLGVPLVDLPSLRARGDRLLLPGLASGRLRVVNPYGTGVADDKRTYPYVEQLVRLHLGEEPLVRSVRSWDLGDPVQRAEAFDRLDELVLKPRSGSGGRGVTVMPRADATTRDAVRHAVSAEPGGWVAQEVVDLSTELTLVDGALVPRHVDLRPCVLSDGVHVTVLDGGLTRVALRAGELVVNCSQGGGAKDTWVVDAPDG